MEVNKIPCLLGWQSKNSFHLFVLCLFAFSCGDLGKEEKEDRLVKSIGNILKTVREDEVKFEKDSIIALKRLNTTMGNVGKVK